MENRLTLCDELDQLESERAYTSADIVNLYEGNVKSFSKEVNTHDKLDQHKLLKKTHIY